MRKSHCYPTKYFKAADLERPVVLTVSRVVKETMTEDGTEKPVCYFEETDKGLVVSPTKWDAFEEITRMPDSNDWVGTQVLLDVGLTRFKGKPVRGIFVHAAPRKQSDADAEQRAEVAAELDDEIPMNWGDEEPSDEPAPAKKAGKRKAA